MKQKKIEKAQKAIRRYLEIVGLEVVEEGWAHGNDTADIIARDTENGDLVFVETRVRDGIGNGFPERKPNRRAFERVAAAYFTEHDVEPSAVRLDVVTIAVLNDSRGSSSTIETHWPPSCSGLRGGRPGGELGRPLLRVGLTARRIRRRFVGAGVASVTSVTFQQK